MPKELKQELVSCQYFTWRLGRRDNNGLYYGDGRSNRINAGRHSLGTVDRIEALASLRQLDLAMAVKFGLADAKVLQQAPENLLPLDEGIKLYMASVQRPPAMGGASKTTFKRYRAIFDKFKVFAAKRHVGHWQEVSKRVLEGYGGWLYDEKYAPATLYIEINTIKQTINWLIAEGHLPESAKINLAVKKVGDSDAFCYTPDQVNAILDHAFGNPDLHWIGNAIVGLVYTGLRISELAQLRWATIDLEHEDKTIRIIDNSGSTAKVDDLVQMSTKTHRSRNLPIHPMLLKVLETIPRHPDGRVFHGPWGGVLKPDTVRRVLIDAVLTPLKSKFPGEPGFRSFANGRLHSFRHFFCSKCASDGIAEQVVMKWLGHTSSRMVQHYYHLHDDESQRQMKKLTSVGGPITAS